MLAAIAVDGGAVLLLPQVPRRRGPSPPLHLHAAMHRIITLLQIDVRP